MSFSAASYEIAISGHELTGLDEMVCRYVTNTNVKFMLVLEDTANPKLADLRETFRRLRLAYVDAISNPFHIQGSALESPTFAARVRAILSTS